MVQPSVTPSFEGKSLTQWHEILSQKLESLL